MAEPPFFPYAVACPATMVLAENRKALHDYELLDEIEVGLVLSGQEAKSAKHGGLRLRGSYGTVRNGSLWLIGAFIAPYKPAGPLPGYDPERSRKLLAHRSQIEKILGRQHGERLTLVPKKAYTVRGRVKIALSLARNKRAFEKRETIRRRETAREVSRALKRR